MKTILLQRRRGSALITVVLLMAMMAVLTASLLNYTMTEKRGNIRNILLLRAKNMAENITVYAAEQLSTRFYRSKPTAAAPFTGSTALKMPDSTGGTGTNNVLGTSKWAVPGNMELYAGVEAPTAMAAVTDPTDTNYGLYVSTVTVPIIAKGTVTHAVNGTFNSYVLQEMKVSMAPLFQFGMFYNMDMELYPSAAFTVAGPVHTNGNLIAHSDGSTNIDIRFTDRVTAAGGLYWQTSLKAAPRTAAGAENLPSESAGNVFFTHTNGTTTANLKGSSGTMTNKWYDHKYGQTTETATTISQFKTNATSVWNGNVRTSAHGVTKLQLPGIGGYNETNLTSTPEDDRNNGRQLIDPPNPRKWQKTPPATVYSWESTTDDADAKETKIAWKAGLFIMANPDASPTPRSGTLPDGTTAYVLPRSYRAWLNTINTSTGVHTVTEVVLPGQPSYGYNAGGDGTLGTSDDYMYHNLLPNRFTATTVAGDGGNAVLRIPQQGLSAASGYLINNASGYAIGATALALDTGTGQILPGQNITIGSFSYLVTAGNASGGAGTINIASPGLRAAVTDNTAVTIGNPANGTASGYLINNSGGYAIGAQTLTLDTGSGTIYPGDTVTIGTRQYVVASGLASNQITLATGIRVATVADNAAVTLENRENTLGTGINYFANGAVAANGTTITVDGGSGTATGTILAGNIIAIGSRQYVVTTPLSAGSFTIANPGIIDPVLDNTPIIVDPFVFSGYSVDVAAPSGAISSGTTYPADNLSAPYSYFPADAYFFDIRRATSNRGVISTSGTTALYNRYAVNYVPRACAKIDFDMARFKMMVRRTINSDTTLVMYDLRTPTGSVNANNATWANSIYKSDATLPGTGFGLGMGATFSVFPAATDIYTKMRQDPFHMYFAPADPSDTTAIDRITGVSGGNNPIYYEVAAGDLYDGTAPDAWYDGIAVYINSVDAEKKAQTSGVPNRIDSGVRMWNGRGNAVSLSAKPGFTLVTNDAMYVIGHFNADGTINSVVTSSTATGGYSARYPDNTSEDLCALMGDAVTIVSQPVWGDATGGQDNGWNDSLSALPVVASTAGWRTGSSATDTLDGSDDGVTLTAANGPKPGLLPNRSYPATTSGVGTATNIKLTGVSTEVSAALLCGIVPSNHNPTNLTDGPVESSYSTWGTAPFNKAGNGVQSGGANNFPRLLDNWNGNGLYIRGSIVALFESRVAMEPFTNSRNYRAPGRFWGLHQGLRDQDHHIPLEPVLIGCNRNRYLELTPAQYEAKKTAIAALH